MKKEKKPSRITVSDGSKRERRVMMFKIHHSLSIYEYEGKRYAEAWIFVKIFNKRFCFWRIRDEIPEIKPVKVTIEANAKEVAEEVIKMIKHDELTRGVKYHRPDHKKC